MDAFICDGTRTPIGRYGGALSGVRADDLAAVPIRALAERYPAADWAALDDVVLGCANQAGEDNRNVARMAALLARLPADVPGVTVNRLCASGMDAVVLAARAIRAGDAEFMIAGGVESMSRAPFVIPKATAAFPRGTEIHDTTIGWRFVNPEMRRLYGTHSMPETADEVARAKEYLIGKMSLDIEDSSSMANMMVRKLLLDNELMSPSEVLEKIKGVSVDEVKAMAKRVIDFSKVNLAVVGPYKKREEFEKLMG